MRSYFQNSTYFLFSFWPKRTKPFVAQLHSIYIWFLSHELHFVNEFEDLARTIVLIAEKKFSSAWHIISILTKKKVKIKPFAEYLHHFDR